MTTVKGLAPARADGTVTSPVAPYTGVGSVWNGDCSDASGLHMALTCAHDGFLIFFDDNGPIRDPAWDWAECIAAAGENCQVWKITHIRVKHLAGDRSPYQLGDCLIAIPPPPDPRVGVLLNDPSSSRIDRGCLETLASSSRVAAGTITPVAAGTPPGAQAVLASLAMVDGFEPGYITADRCSMMTAGPQPKANGTHGLGIAVANEAVIPLDADGRFCLFNQSRVQEIADIQGAFAPAGPGGLGFVPTAPTRIADTRVTPGVRPVAGGITRVVTGVPAGTAMALVNLSMVDADDPGYVTADRCSVLQHQPQSKANGTYMPHNAVSNLAAVPLDTDGSFCIYNYTTVHVIVDLQGYFAAGAPAGLHLELGVPSRKLDTRVAPATTPAAGSITRVQTGVPAATRAVLVNVAMVDAAASGYITADRCSALSTGPQTKANGAYSRGDTISNLSVVPVDADGSFCIYTYAPVDLVVDVQGAFSPDGTLDLFPLTQHRALDTRAPHSSTTPTPPPLSVTAGKFGGCFTDNGHTVVLWSLVVRGTPTQPSAPGAAPAYSTSGEVWSLVFQTTAASGPFSSPAVTVTAASDTVDVPAGTITGTCP